MGYKARLVSKGFMQREGVEFPETFAPVAKFASIALLIPNCYVLQFKFGPNEYNYSIPES